MPPNSIQASNGLNGSVNPPMPNVAPIGPIGSNNGNKLSNSFSSHFSPIVSPQALSSSIGDSLRKNLQVINVNENQGLRGILDNPMDLASGLQNMSIPMDNKMQEPPNPETSKLWSYGNCMPANSNNNGTASGLPPIGYPKWNGMVGPGGDASSALMPLPSGDQPRSTFHGDFSFDLNSNMPLTKSQDKEIGRALENEINSLSVVRIFLFLFLS